MSRKGILPQTRNGSGQIEDECKKKRSDVLGFLKNGEYGLVTTDSIVPDTNQDVAEDCSNGEDTESGVLEIASSTNFILSSAEVTSDVVGVSVDDWFKHKSDGSMDLDSVLTTDGIEVNDLEAYHFAAAKDNVDMCIVTNICDMGLGFDLPVNMCDKCNHNVGECDCDERAVGEFADTSFLDDFSKSDREKSMLIKVNNPKLSENSDILNEKDKEIADSYILQFHDKEGKETNSKGGDWNQSDVYGDAHPVVLKQEKVSWEALSNVSQHSTDYDSEKDVDFSEFSLLTYQVENSEGINIINTLSQIDCESDNDGVPGNVIVSEDYILPDSVQLKTCDSEQQLVDNPNTQTDCVSDNDGVPGNVIVSEDFILPDIVQFEACETEQQPVDNPNTQKLDSNKEKRIKKETATAVSTKNNALDVRIKPTVAVNRTPSIKVQNKINSSGVKKGATSNRSLSHPRSLLRPSQKTTITSKADSVQTSLLENLSRTFSSVSTQAQGEIENCTLQSGTKKTPAMTIIAISTDKSKNTTEIVINTSQGEQKFKGKTSDFIKATSKLFSQTVKAKIGQNLNLSNVDLNREEVITAQTESEIDWMQCEKNKSVADEQPITEALATLGIDSANLTCLITGGNNGFKLWPCPIPDCEKLYPRLSLLKVHILTHYGVRPYKCDTPGCLWTFYTYFKLKRHKETHMKRKDFICPVPSCGHRFTTTYNLKTHRKLHERPAKLQCPVVGCDAHFQTKRAVEFHVKKHGISHAPYQCTFAGCGKRYYSNNTLNSHARSHQHREEEVRCQWPDCGKLFDKPCRLKAHMRTHTGDKPYLCIYQKCGWAFSSASKLKRHQQKHTNERKFLCTYDGCGKSFMRSEHLKEHTQTHKGERSYQCTEENCGVKFTAKSSLYVHLKKHKQQLIGASIVPEGQPALQLQSSSPAQFQLQKSKKQVAAELVTSKWEDMQNEETMQVIVPGNGRPFHCPVESCPKSYNCKASLRQHLLKHHTPVLASDASLLDCVTSLLLSGGSNQQVLVSTSEEQAVVTSDGLSTVSLQGPMCTVAVAGADLNSTGLLTTRSLFDPATAYSSEFVNTDLLSAPNINNMLVVTHEPAEGDTILGETETSTRLVTSDATTSIAVPDSDIELHLATESISDSLLVGEYKRTRVVAYDLEPLSASEANEIADDPTCQAARTNLTHHDVVLRKHLQFATNTSASASDKSVGNSSDNGSVTIGSSNTGTGSIESALTDTIVGLRDPVTTLCLPPEMAGLVTPATDLNLLLQEESGLHVLLLDGGESQFYTESTINLRDLE